MELNKFDLWFAIFVLNFLNVDSNYLLRFGSLRRNHLEPNTAKVIALLHIEFGSKIFSILCCQKAHVIAQFLMSSPSPITIQKNFVKFKILKVRFGDFFGPSWETAAKNVPKLYLAPPSRKNLGTSYANSCTHDKRIVQINTMSDRYRTAILKLDTTEHN